MIDRLLRTVGILTIGFGIATVGCATPTVIDPAVTSGIGVNNGTTLPVTIFVNGSMIETVAPHRLAELAGHRLPGLPWEITAKSPTGRTLVELRVDPGTVTKTTNLDGSTSSRSAGNRVDLSCGRLDIYVGEPMMGPVPAPGVPGDCDP